MADIKQLAPLILKFEGGFVNDKVDKGGATNMGITLETAQHFHLDMDNDGDVDAFDVKALGLKEFTTVLKIGYWDVWRADQIKNQSVANILVDWLWASGVWGIKIPQRILGLKEDGVVGPATIAAVNNADQGDLFYKIQQERIKFIDNIIKRDPTQKRFEKGWKNRVMSYRFQA